MERVPSSADSSSASPEFTHAPVFSSVGDVALPAQDGRVPLPTSRELGALSGRSDIDRAMLVALDRATLADHDLPAWAASSGPALESQAPLARRLDIETAMLVALERAKVPGYAVLASERSAPEPDRDPRGTTDPGGKW